MYDVLLPKCDYMLVSSYSVNQRVEAEMMTPFVIEESEHHFKVPKSKIMGILKFRPEALMKLKDDDFYLVSKDKYDDRPFNTFHCTCVHGTYRDGKEEQERKYCKHCLAVILWLVKNGKLNKIWKDAIYGTD